MTDNLITANQTTARKKLRYRSCTVAILFFKNSILLNVLCHHLFQPARFFLPVVHESTQDPKIHYLEELQMGYPQSVLVPSPGGLYWSYCVFYAR